MFILDGTAADAECQPARRDLVQRRRHLGQDRGMTELVAQHHMSDPDTFGTAEQRGGQRPRLHRRVVRHSRRVEVVVEPDRVDAELLAAQRAMQHLLVGETHLRQIDPDLRLGHDRSSNLPWVMVVVPLAAASKANECSLMPKAFTVRSQSSGVGDANRTATRRTRPGSSTPNRAEHVGACRSPSCTGRG